MNLASDWLMATMTAALFAISGFTFRSAFKRLDDAFIRLDRFSKTVSNLDKSLSLLQQAFGTQTRTSEEMSEDLKNLRNETKDELAQIRFDLNRSEDKLNSMFLIAEFCQKNNESCGLKTIGIRKSLGNKQ